MAERTEIEIRASDQTQAAVRSVGEGMRRLEDASGRLAAQFGRVSGLIAGVGFGAFVALAKNAIDSAAAFDDLAESTGGTVEGLSSIVDQARISGEGIETVASAMTRLTQQLRGTEEQSGGAADALKAIGLDIKALRELRADEAFRLIADQLIKFEDGLGKSSVALALFGRSGAQILPLLKDLAEQTDRSATLSAEQAAAAERAQKAINALGVSFSNATRSIVVEFVPGLTDAIDKISTFIKSAGGIDAAFGAVTAGALRKTLPELKKELGDLESLLKKQESSFVGRNLPGVGVDFTKRKIDDVKKAISATEGLRELQRKQALALGEGVVDREARGVPRGQGGKLALDFLSREKTKDTSGGAAKSISEGERLIQQLTIEAARRDDLTRVKELEIQLDAKAIKFDSEAQRTKAFRIAQSIDDIRIRKEEAAAIREHFQHLEQEAQSLERELQTLGKTRSEIEATSAARIDEAIAIARLNGASEEQIGFLERERDLRRQIAESASRQEIEQFRGLGQDARIEEQRKKLVRMAESVGEAGGLTPEQFSQSSAAFLGIEKQAQETFDDITKFAQKAAENIQDALADGFFNLMQGKFDNLGDQFKQTLDRMAANIIAAQLGQKLFGSFQTTGKLDSGSWIGQLFGSFGGSSGDTASSAFAALSNLGLESFAVGTDFVPRDMLAMIHRGEAVIPAAENVGGGRGVVVNINGVRDPFEWKASRGQIAADAQRMIGGGRRFS